jgi:hypothetical protein
MSLTRTWKLIGVGVGALGMVAIAVAISLDLDGIESTQEIKGVKATSDSIPNQS